METDPSLNDNNHLKRSLGLATVVALGLNCVIGQGIFLLPGKAAQLMGPGALWAFVLAAVLCLLISLCFAEVSSRFEQTGGAYLYAQRAFGDFVGFEVGWMTCCVAVIGWAALANGFTEVLATVIPGVSQGWQQPVIAIGLVTLLTIINLCGVRSGARIVNVFTVAKLIPIALFVVIGLFHIDGSRYVPFTPHGVAPLADTTLLLLYAFAGFENMVVPAGEMNNPKRSVPLALCLVMAVVSVVYISVYCVATGTFTEIAGHGNPVAAAAGQFMGPVGGLFIAVGICLSVLGTNAVTALINPRRFYAMAERRDLPKALGWVHPKTGAPVAAIVVTWGLVSLLTLSGTFEELAVLSVIARFVQYIPTCLAVLVLRRDDASPRDGFVLPLGPVIPLVTVGLCGWLLLEKFLSKPEAIYQGLIALAVGVPLYALSRFWLRRQS